jgi:TIR domain
MTNDFDHDVLISYRGAEPDRTWVGRTLVPRLAEHGLRVGVDYRCFKLGEPLTTSMEKAVSTSRYTLAIMTPAYPQGPFATFERTRARHLDLEQQQRRLVVAARTEQPTPEQPVQTLAGHDQRHDLRRNADSALCRAARASR